MPPDFVVNLDQFHTIGKVLRVFALLDAVFVYKDGKLHHYAGVLGGWRLHETTDQATEQAAHGHIESWFKSL